MKIRVSFLTEYNTLCGIFEITLHNQFLTKENIHSMVNINIDLNNTFKQTGKLNSKHVLEQLQNIFGESANIILDLNIDYYGDQEIEHMLLNEIGGEHKIIISINDDFLNFIDILEEGSQHKLQNIIEQNGINIYI